MTWNGGSFSVLVGDTEVVSVGDWINSAHPDDEQVLFLETRQDQWVTSGSDTTNMGTGQYRFSFSYWVNWQNLNRGRIDRNFAHEDGSVRQIRQLEASNDPLEELPAVATAVPGLLTWLPSD